MNLVYGREVFSNIGFKLVQKSGDSFLQYNREELILFKAFDLWYLVGGLVFA